MEKDFKQVLEEIQAGTIEKTEQINHVAYYLLEKTSYSFHFYAMYERSGKSVLTEFLYDLRYKKYFMKRNGSEVRFNVANLDTVIPRLKDGYSSSGAGFCSSESINKFFNMVSVKENEGMYNAMMKAIGSIGDERTQMTSRALIRLITTYNKLELLYKAGLDVMFMKNANFRDCVYAASQNDVKKVHEIFGVTKAQYKFLNEFLANGAVFAEHLKTTRTLTQKDMDTYRGYIKYIQELEEKYNIDGRLRNFKQHASFVSFLNATWSKHVNHGYDDRNFYRFLTHNNHPNPLKLIEYLLFECYVSQGIEDFRVAYSEYQDYYRMCTELQYERFDKYPKYLKTQHDIVSRNYSSIKDEKANKEFAKVTAEYKDWETTLGNYVIVVPDTAKDLVHEGNVLQHCVGSYVKKVASGSSRIVFLREKEARDEPLVTVEIRGSEIVQVRGQANRFPTDDEKEAMRRFAKRKELKFKSIV